MEIKHKSLVERFKSSLINLLTTSEREVERRKDYDEKITKFNQEGKGFYMNVIYLWYIMVSFGILYAVNATQFYFLGCTIMGGVSLIIQFTILILYCFNKRFQKWNHVKFFISSTIHVLLCTNFFLAKYTFLYSENNLLKRDYIVSMFFYYFLLSTFLTLLFNNLDNWSHFLIIIINVKFIFYLNLLNADKWETIAVVAVTFGVLLLQKKSQYLGFSYWDEFDILKKKLEHCNGIIDHCQAGYCMIDKNFKIQHVNKFFTKHFSHLIENRESKLEKFSKQNLVKKEGKKIVFYQPIKEHAEATKSQNVASFNLFINSNDSPLQNNLNSKLEEENHNFLGATLLYQKFEPSDNVIPAWNRNQNQNIFFKKMNDSVDQENCYSNGNKVRRTLKKVIENFMISGTDKNRNNPENIRILINNEEIQNQNDESDNFVSLNKFKYASKNSNNMFGNPSIHNQHLYEILIRKNPISEDNYELLFKDITKYTKEEKTKAEKKYKNMLIAKISHEFKAPAMYIQNTIDNILEHKLLSMQNLHCNQAMEASNEAVIDAFNKIKYLTELILILVLDLSEYALLDSAEAFSPIAKNLNKSNLEISTLKEYIKNMCDCLMLIYNKRLECEVNLDEEIEFGKIVTDEKKFKQVLAHILSNAIKSCSDGGRVKITIKPKESPCGEYKDKSTLINMLEKDKCYSLRQGNNIDNNIDFEKRMQRNSLFILNPQKMMSSKSRNEDGFAIIIEDSGNGIEESLMNMINIEKNNFRHRSSANLEEIPRNRLSINENGFSDINRINMDTYSEMDNYANTKSMGKGLQICKKLGREIGVSIKCSLLKDYKAHKNNSLASETFTLETHTFSSKPSAGRSIIKGTKFTLLYNGEVEIQSIGTLTNTVVSRSRGMFNIPLHEKMLVQYDETCSNLNESSSSNIVLINGINEADVVRDLTIQKTLSFGIEGQIIMPAPQLFITRKKFSVASSDDLSSYDTYSNTNYPSTTHAHTLKDHTGKEIPSLSNSVNKQMLYTASPNTKMRRLSMYPQHLTLGNSNTVNPRRHSGINSNSILKNVLRRESESKEFRKSINNPSQSHISRPSLSMFQHDNSIMEEMPGADLMNFMDGEESYRNLLSQLHQRDHSVISEKEETEEKKNSFSGDKDTNHNNSIYNINKSGELNKEYPLQISSSNNLNINSLKRKSGLSNVSGMPNKISASHNIHLNSYALSSPEKSKLTTKRAKTLNSESSQSSDYEDYESKSDHEKHIKILVVDDNVNNQEAIEKLAKRYISQYNKNNKNKKQKKIRIKKLNDGIELVYEIYKEITKTGKTISQVIFCDEMMNYMNGSEAFGIIMKIINDKNLKKVPFVICSSFNQEEHFKRMKSLSIEHVYEKPLSYGNIEYLLNNFLK